MNDTVLGLPINRFVTFVQPLLNAGAGLVAAWLVAKVQILGILGVGQDQLATQLAALASALVVTGLLEIGRQQWIKGHHLEITNGAFVLEDDEAALLGDGVAGLPIDAPGVDEGDAGRP